jgi:salicylate hydroxylase
MSQKLDVLVAGGGIGGLATALACARSGFQVRLFERAPEFSEVGAGIQLGPNVIRILRAWDLEASLRQVVAFPSSLDVRCALSSDLLATMRLQGRSEALYGAPYATVHRADFHQLLLNALRSEGASSLRLASRVCGVVQHAEGVGLTLLDGKSVEGDVLVGADGLWSTVRSQVLGDVAPRLTGHLAFRAMVAQAQLPKALRSQKVTAWLGPRLHVVAYPVRSGEWLNVVAVVHGAIDGDFSDWDHGTNGDLLLSSLVGTCSALQDFVRALPQWRLWVLCDRPPVASADGMARGRVALLGDAAHPMRPYLAQGAAMAIEDAQALVRSLQMSEIDVPTRLKRYALNRWQRCARVQARSQRNGRIFHADGLARWTRNLGLRCFGERVMDVPWLYAGDAHL